MTLVDRVARRMRAARRACRTVVLRLRFDDFSRATRSHTIAEATSRTSTLLRIARGLLAASGAVIARRGLTLIGIALTNLCDQDAIQLALPFDRTAGLDRTLDAVRERFGAGRDLPRGAGGPGRGTMGAPAPRLRPPGRCSAAACRQGRPRRCTAHSSARRARRKRRSGSALVSSRARR